MAEDTGFVLVDYEGNTRPYVGAETVLFLSPEGEMVPYSEGAAVEGVEIIPDFSDGDQIVEAPAGTLVKSAVIRKPDNLLPENIRRGERVAGIDGDFIGDTEEITVDLYMADGDQIILPSADGKVISKVTVRKPDSLVPGNIAEGAEIAGVNGVFAGGSGALDDMLRYFDTHIDPKNREVVISKIHYDLLYEDNGNYDVTIPDSICGLGVVINTG